MKTLGNIIWFLLIGLWEGLVYFVAGALFCATLICIPFGIACFRLGCLAFFPFGKTVETDFEARPVLNVIWLAICGAYSAVGYAVAGAILCVTIVGIPLGKQFFKLMKLSALPFGAEVC